MGVCSAFECNNASEKKQTVDTSFHSFPKEKNILRQWLSFCRRKDPINPKTARLCSLHFVKDDFINNIEYEMGFSCRRRLKPGAVPKVNITVPQCIIVNYKKKELDDSALEDFCYIDPDDLKQEVDSILVENEAERQTPTFELEDMALEMSIMKEQMTKLKKENSVLKTSLLDSKNKIEELTTLLQQSNCKKKNVERRLREMFTEGQVKQLQNRSKKVDWSDEDIATSLTLYSVSSKAYMLLRKKKFPIPPPRTLQQWAHKLKRNPKLRKN